MKNISQVIKGIKGYSQVLKDLSEAMNPFDSEVLFLVLERGVELGTLYINRIDLSKETRDQTEDMLVALTRLFYEMVYKRSPAWQEMAREWAEGKRGWKVDFDEAFKAFVEGREKTVILPPSKKAHNVFIYVEEGETITAFKAERELVFAFLREADELIFNEFARPLNFGVLTTTTEFIKALILGLARGMVLTEAFYPNDSIYRSVRLIL
jgi:hypothetical protein